MSTFPESAIQHSRSRRPGLIDPLASIGVPLFTSLTHYYTLEEASGTRVDSVGGTSLSPTAAPGNAAGIVGNGLSVVAASTQYISGTSLLVKSADHSISFWFKPTATGINATQRGLFSCGNTNADNSPMWIIGTSMNGATAKLGVFDAGYHNGSTTLVAGNWYHVVVIKSAAGVVSAYLNNAVEVSFTQVDGGDNNNSYIGSGFGGTFDGVIDELATWSRTLSSAEVATLYNGGAGITYPFA